MAQTGRVYLDASSFLKCRFVLLAHDVKSRANRVGLDRRTAKMLVLCNADCGLSLQLHSNLILPFHHHESCPQARHSFFSCLLLAKIFYDSFNKPRHGVFLIQFASMPSSPSMSPSRSPCQ